MDKGNYVIDFECHYQMCEFLALSESKVSNQSILKSFQCIIYITGKDHLLPLNSLGVSFYYTGAFFISLLVTSHYRHGNYVDFLAL